MENVFVETSRVIDFRQAAAVVSDTAKGHPGLMVAWGLAGRGKTMCAREYAVRHPEVIYIRVFEGWTPTAMLARICEELNGLRPRRTNQAKRMILEELDMAPRTLIMDEADRLDNSNVEHLRDIHDETGAPIILVGEPSLYGRLTSRPRIWQRVTRVVEFGAVTTEDVVIFAMKACSLKVEPAAAVALVKRCQGSFRLLYHAMIELEQMARANKAETIPAKMIKALPDRRKAPKGYKGGQS